MFEFLKDIIVEVSDDLKKGWSYYHDNDNLLKVDKNLPKLDR